MILKFTSLNSNRQQIPPIRGYCSIMLSLLFALFFSQQTVAQTSPQFTMCPGNASVQLPAGGGTLSLNQFNLGVNANDPDGTGTITYTVSPATVDCSDVDNTPPITPVTVTVTADDGIDTPTDCIFNVVVQDGGPFAVANPLTVTLNAAGTYALTAADLAAISMGSTSCNAFTVMVSQNTFTCADIAASPITVTVTITDMTTGSTSMDNTTITVQGDAPMATCMNASVNLDATGNANIVVADVDGGSTTGFCPGGMVTATPLAFTCADVPSAMVTVTATNASGQTSTCMATVTVNDMIAPTAVCSSIVATLTGNPGTFTVNATDIDNGSSDNCGGNLTYTISETAAPGVQTFVLFNCTDIGSNDVWLTVSDGTNNSTTAMPCTVTLSDNTAPMIGAVPADQNLSTSSGASMFDCIADFSWTHPAASDDCGVTSYAVAYTAGIPAPANLPTGGMLPPAGGPSGTIMFEVGTTIITYTADDAAGNGPVTTSFMVTVVDDVAPNITGCLSNLTFNSDPSDCDNTVSFLPPTIEDCEANVIITVTTTPSIVLNNATGVVGTPGTVDFGDFPVGVTTVEYSYSDGTNTFSCAPFTVTVFDNQTPVIPACPPTQTVNFGSCNAANVLVEDYRGLLSYQDNCPADVSITQSPAQNSTWVSNGITPTDGTSTTVTLTVTDNNPNPMGGFNTTSCTFTVNFVDNSNPVPNVPGILPTVMTDCGPPLIVQAPTATDACGNIISGIPTPAGIATPFITTSAPNQSFTDAPASAIVEGSPTVATINVTTFDPAAIIDDVNFDLDLDHGWVGDLQVVITSPSGTNATMVNANCVGEASIDATFDDGGAPFMCPGVFGATLTGTIQPEVTPLSVFNGENPNGVWTLTITDTNTSSVGDIGTLNTWGLNISTSADLWSFGLGTHNVSWEYFDGTNFTYQDQTIIVQNDATPPTITCQDINIDLDANGQASIANFGSSIIEDISFTSGYFQNFPLPFTFPFYGGAGLGGFDANSLFVGRDGEVAFTNNFRLYHALVNGNLDPDNGGDVYFFTMGSSPNQMFVLNYVNVPVVGSAGTITTQVVLHESGLIEIFGTDINTGGVNAFQALGSTGPGIFNVLVPGRFNTPLALTNDYVSFVPDGTGGYAVDQSGLFCPVQTPFALEDLLSSLTDNCGVDFTSLAISQSSFDCTDAGSAVPVTISVSDINSLSNSCTAMITISDSKLPALVNVPAADLSIDCSMTPDTTGLNVYATDNCSSSPNIIFNTSTTQTSNTSDCSFYTYDVTYTWTAVDANSNQASESYTVSVSDNDLPEFDVNLPGSTTVGTGLNCNAQVNVSVNAATLTDCAPFNQLTISYEVDLDNDGSINLVSSGSVASGLYPVGTHKIIFYAEDPCGNMAVPYETLVIVNDITPPTASCSAPITLGLPASGQTQITELQINNNSFDNCFGPSSLLYSIDNSIFDCSNADGVTQWPVTLTVTEPGVGGLSSTCETFVIIQDNSLPTAVCRDINITLDANGMASITPAQVNNGSSDNCFSGDPAMGIASMSLDTFNFNQTDFGPNPVILTVADSTGNTASCSATVNVNFPETCFLLGGPSTVTAGAGTTISYPVSVTGFTSVSSFQFAMEFLNPDVAEFLGVEIVHPALAPLDTVFLQSLIQTDSFISDVDSTVIVLGNWNMTMDTTLYDTIYTGNFDQVFVTWQSPTAATIPDGDTAFFLSVLITGDLLESTFVDSITSMNGSQPEISYKFGNFISPQLTPCIDDGAIFINEILIAGDIYDELGNPAKDVIVDLDRQQTTFPFDFLNVDTETTLADGAYSFTVSSSANFMVAPYKYSNWPNGLTSADVSAIQRHTLNTGIGDDDLGSSYKEIAADVNNDYEVSTFDALILNQYVATAFTTPPPAGIPSWRFVPATPALPYDPFVTVESYDTTILFVGLVSDTIDNDFIAVKMGDVNNTANAQNITGGADPLNGEDVSFIVENQTLKAGEIVEVAVRAGDFESLLAYQWIMDFDQSVLRFEDVKMGTLSALGMKNFGLTLLDQGKIVMTWYEVTPQTAATDDVLFTFTFEALRDGASLSELLSIGEMPFFLNEAYGSTYDTRKIELRFSDSDKELVNPFALMQNTPNPFKDETSIGFYLPEATTAKITLMDISGRLLKSIEIDGTQGYNEVSIDKTDLPLSGVVHYTLETSTNTATKKMIIIE